jgi:hypothetical protein
MGGQEVPLGSLLRLDQEDRLEGAEILVVQKEVERQSAEKSRDATEKALQVFEEKQVAIVEKRVAEEIGETHRPYGMRLHRHAGDEDGEEAAFQDEKVKRKPHEHEDEGV